MSPQVAKLFIANGIDINQTERRKTERTLWCGCVISGQEVRKIVEMAQLLIAKGIDINQTDKYRWNNATKLLRENWRVSESNKKGKYLSYYTGSG